MNPKGVFFDLYGTLALCDDDSAWEAWYAAMHERLSTHGLTMSPASLKAHCGDFFDRPEPPASNDGLTVYERRILAMCHELNLDMARERVGDVATATADGWHDHIRPDPDALPVLRELRETKALALVSNFDHPPHAHALLQESGMADVFDAVVVSGDVGVKKPDPRIFRPALQAVGLQPDEVVFVGDSAEDVQGAQAAGITPILIRRDGLPEGNLQRGGDIDPGWARNVRVVRGLRELTALDSTARDAEVSE